MRAFRQLASIAVLLSLPATFGLAQSLPARTMPAGTQVEKVWHLGRVTGDLPRIIAFYHDLLGLGLRGDRAPIPFYSVAAINEFVNAPPHAEFRAGFMPIPGASPATDAAAQVYLEAFEYRNIDRRQVLPPLSSPGVSSLRVLVRDLDGLIAAATAANVRWITRNGAPIAVPAPHGLVGPARAVMVRDPDGYPVELMEATDGSTAGRVAGAHMSVVVRDLDASLAFYRRVGAGDLLVGTPSACTDAAAIARLRDLPEMPCRTAAIALPGSSIVLELIQFSGPAAPYTPAFQDIGHGHVAFIVTDIAAFVARMTDAGARTLSASGTWTPINGTTRAVYTRDPDGFFLEILERR